MNRLKKILAVLLVTAIFTVSGADAIQAAVAAEQNIFSKIVTSFTKGNGKNSKNSDLIVVLDPGHGGLDTGAMGYGLEEEDLTLKIARYCQKELEKYKGVKVYMTRTTDTYVGLNERIEKASELKADVFVSLHINSSVSNTAKGAEVYYPNSNYRPSCGKKGRILASAIQKNLVALGAFNRGVKTLDSKSGDTYKDGSKADYYAVIRGAKKAGYPGIIVEHAFISNKSDAKEFLSTSYTLKKLGVADAKGIAAAYGLKKSKDSADSLQKTEITKLTGKNSKSVYLKWKEVENADGYEVYRSTSEKGSYKKIVTVKEEDSISYKDKSVKAGKSYYYKVRPYKKSGAKKIKAGFSKAQKVKVLKMPAIAVKVQSKSRIKISWKKVDGALKYEIYRSNSKEGVYQKIATVKDVASYKDTRLESGAVYYYKVRAVCNGIKGNTYSSYSTVKW